MTTNITIQELMKEAQATGASDLILVAGKPACVYLHGRMQTLNDDRLLPVELNGLIESFLSETQRTQLADTGDVDFSLGIPGVGRARINVHKQRGSYAAAIRFVQTSIPSFEDLHLPPKLRELAGLPRGLILITGATGSGKSTTLAAMIEYMNHQFDRHIITLEDPIEYLFNHNRCAIEQREIGQDSPSFAQALRHVVRQKPDVILVGEMRDRETIATALTASETGHLVLGTLHTNTAANAIERIIDVFEPGQQNQIRTQLANTLQAVFCQSLIPRADHKGVVPAIEILTMTQGIRRAIRDSETHLLPGMIETGQKYGMVTLDHCLAHLCKTQVIEPKDALRKAVEPEKLQRLIGFEGNLLDTLESPDSILSPEPQAITAATSGLSDDEILSSPDSMWS